MGATLTQDNRLLAVETPLGKDKLILTSFHGREEMSRLFSYQLEMISAEDSIKPADIVGKSVSWRVKLDDGSDRWFNGYVNSFAAGDRESGMRRYRANVVPWLWFLTRTTDLRIFQEKTVPDIIEQIFGDLGFSDFDNSGIQGSHPTWVYCVQYRETDFNFVSRLMEQEGIFYFFQHEQGSHKMVLADSKSAYKPLPEKSVEYEKTYTRRQKEDRVTVWEHRYDYVSGKYAQTDYNFETPKTSLMTNESTVVKLPDISKYEVYDYPGEYGVKGDGQDLTKLYMEEVETPYDVARGASTCRTFAVGGKFTFKKHDCEDEEGKTYVITSIQHSGNEPTDVDGSFRETDYENSFTCIPENVTFRPARTTRKPFVQGPQTAVVVGPSGEEIYTDKYGRIKVQFHWDREGQKDENSSCWMRCMQVSAGRNWGVMSIPRIGQEVVVTFLEGDPDNPLVTGVVYNADQMPAYELPGEKTKSYIKTNSSKGGDGYNEIRFEDKAGEEQIFVHAQKNMDERVLNESMERVILHRHLIVGNDDSSDGDQRELVYHHKHLNVKQDQVEKIEGDFKLTVGYGNADNPGNLDLAIAANKKESIGGEKHLTVEGPSLTKVAGKVSEKYGDALHQKVASDYGHESGGSIHLKAGMSVVIEAGAQISLKVGGSFVAISAGGVYITGPMVLINSGGSAGSGGGCSPDDAEAAAEAEPTEPTMADDSKTGKKSCD